MKNNLIVGSTGTGKREKEMENVKSCINNGESLFILSDSKEYYDTFKNELENNNYKVVFINYRDLATSDKFDLLNYAEYLYKNGKSDAAIQLLEVIAKSLFKTDESIDPFWENSAATIFTSVAISLIESNKKVGFREISNIIRLDYDGSGGLKKYFEEFDHEGVAYRIGECVFNAPVETRGGIISIARQKLSIYADREQILNVISNSTFELNELSGKIAIIINADGLNDSYNPLNTIFVYEIYHYLHNNEHNKFNFIIDNYELLKPIDDINNIINCSSSDDANFSFVLRDLENFKAKYGNIIDKFEIINLD